jgi:MFS family permease
MLPIERRAALSLALIYMVRMLGLFIILPVFALFASDFDKSTPFLIGLALGIYGLFQAMLQIPFGLLSDRIGRKKTIAMGLVFMIVGSVVAAMADSIYMVILGRALQGAGAITAALMALAADLSRDEQRTKMMATLGASIGFSFLLALLLGPLLIKVFSVSMLFWLTAVMASLALLMLFTIVPDPKVSGFSADTSVNTSTLRELVSNNQLLRLNVSIFFLHLLITATFVAVPLLLRDNANLLQGDHWQVYLPAMLLSVLVMVPMIIVAERYRLMRNVLLACVVGLLVTQVLFASVPTSLLVLFSCVVLFFCFLNTLEALLPSLVSRVAPAGSRGSATGIYSSSQFLGAFVGGAGGGWLLGKLGFGGLFLAMAGVCVVWLLCLWHFVPPKAVKTHRRVLNDQELATNEAELRAKLVAEPGVEEVMISLKEGIAYMKVDKTTFRPSA